MWEVSTSKKDGDNNSESFRDENSASKDVQPGSDHPELIHGSFSNCICKRCMENAKAEVEKRLSDETVTMKYIKKLEEMIYNLQTTNDHLKKSQGPRIYRQESLESLREVDPFNPPAMDPKDTAALLQTTEGPKAKIRRMKKVSSAYGEETIEKDYDILVGEAKPRSYASENVLTVFRHFDKKSAFWRRSIEILSPEFVEVLRHVADCDIDISLIDDALTLTEPLMVLFHHRNQLEKYLQGQDEDGSSVQARAHTKLILDYMKDEYEGLNRTIDDLESAKPSGLITFPEIWLLYPPGTVVYTSENGEYEAFVVDSVRGVGKNPRGRSRRQLHDRLELTCWSINYDGEIFGREWSTLIMSPFNGTKEIASLDIIPERFLTDVDHIKDSLRARGKLFWSLQGQNYREYTGEIWSQHMSEESIRVMVDHLTYQRRMDWPIVINKKRGPSNALSKNWRDSKFALRGRPFDSFDNGRGRRPRVAPPCIVPYEDRRIYSPDRNYDEPYEEPYKRYECDRPPLRADSKFSKYDVLALDSDPDELSLLLCPQQVHGYCLRDKTWSGFLI